MKTIPLAFALVAAFSTSAQNTLLVDNTPTAPGGTHVYSSLQAAIDATVPGDIIHVKPSNVSYGNITIGQANDSISIFGIGIKPDKEILLRSIVDNVEINGFNIRVSGLQASSIDVANNSTSENAGNVQIENCWVTTGSGIAVGAGTPETASNVIVRNCITNTLNIGSSATGTVVTNSVIYYSTGTVTGAVNANNGTLITHCLFYGDGATRNAFSTVQNSTISNCIFYGRAPLASGTNSNNTWNNNYAEQCYDNNFSTADGNSVNGTITSITGLLFADAGIPNPVVTSSLTWNVNFDPALDPTGAAELLNAGDDGTDIGLSGGTIPFSITGTPLPYIKSFVVPSVIKLGDDLDVGINALGN